MERIGNPKDRFEAPVVVSGRIHSAEDRTAVMQRKYAKWFWLTKKEMAFPLKDQENGRYPARSASPRRQEMAAATNQKERTRDHFLSWVREIAAAKSPA